MNMYFVDELKVGRNSFGIYMSSVTTFTVFLLIQSGTYDSENTTRNKLFTHGMFLATPLK